MNPAKQFILLTGISGSGKSSYAKHLEADYGFRYIPTDHHDENIREVLEQNDGFVDRHLGDYPRVVMEWGFHPQFLGYVLLLKRQGARLLWFKADLTFARSQYLETHRQSDPSGLAWDYQVLQIRSAHLPTPDFKIVETVYDGKFRSHEDLDRIILS